MWQRYIRILSKTKGSIYAYILLSQKSILELRSTQRYFRLTNRKNQCHDILLHSILHVFLFLFVLSHPICQKIHHNFITHTLKQLSTLTPVPSLAQYRRHIFYYLLQGQDFASHRTNPYNYCNSDKKLTLLLCIKEILSKWKYTEDTECFLNTKQLWMQTKTQNSRVLSNIDLNAK
jgi:hypothetical protein